MRACMPQSGSMAVRGDSGVVVIGMSEVQPQAAAFDPRGFCPWRRTVISIPEPSPSAAVIQTGDASARQDDEQAIEQSNVPRISRWDGRTSRHGGRELQKKSGLAGP